MKALLATEHPAVKLRLVPDARVSSALRWPRYNQILGRGNWSLGELRGQDALAFWCTRSADTDDPDLTRQLIMGFNSPPVSDPIDQIRRRTGYGDPAAFRRIFKQTTGLSPSSYRHAYGLRNSRDN